MPKQFWALDYVSIYIYCCDLIKSVECKACMFLAYAICEAMTTLSSVFLCLFVAWAHVTCSITGLPLNRSLNWLIVTHVLLDLKWCLCGFDLPLGWRQNLCAIVPQNTALLNRLHAPLLQLLSAQMATPLLPLSMYSSSAESCLWSWPLLYSLCLLFTLVFICYFLARLQLQFSSTCVLSLKQFSVFTTLHP
jgi:hypothetical protein